MKKIVKYLAVIVCCLSLVTGEGWKVNAKSSITTKTLACKDTTISNLGIQLDSCNVNIKKTNSKKISCKYDKNLFQVELVKKDDKITVKVEGTSRKSQTPKKVVKLYIPESMKVDITKIQADSAGVGMDYVLDSNLKIEGNSCSVSLAEPKDFKHNIDIKLESSSGTFSMPNEVCLMKDNSAVACPKKLDNTADQTNARIVIQLTSSSFSIKTFE